MLQGGGQFTRNEETWVRGSDNRILSVLKSKSGPGKNSKQIRGSSKRPLKLVAGLMISFILCYTPFQVFNLLRALEIYIEPTHCLAFEQVMQA